MAEVIGVHDLYANLKNKASERASKHSILDVLTRLREGVKSPHARNILSLYWWHVFQTDRALYQRLKSSTDEAAMRQILGGKVMTSYVQGEKTVTLCSDVFPPEFFEIIDAYLEYTDDLAR